MDEELTGHHKGIIDSLVLLQREENREISEECDIMAIPAGARLLKWRHKVISTCYNQYFGLENYSFFAH